MNMFNDIVDSSHKSFFSHVFSSTDEGKAELLNVIQYSGLGIIPIVILNKLIHRFIPEADPDKSSLEILLEIFIQLIAMFCGITLIHRMITYIPTYSQFKYESLALTNVILAFLVLMFSIQTKLGMKVNILVDRVYDAWHGTESGAKGKIRKSSSSYVSVGGHTPSRADYLDSSTIQQDIFPPAPVASSAVPASPPVASYSGPMAANTVLGGGGFGSFF
jgi:hypothetical protein